MSVAAALAARLRITENLLFKNLHAEAQLRGVAESLLSGNPHTKAQRRKGD
jgi:hypothetical protein